MKRKVILPIAIALMVGTFAGCGGNANSGAASGNEASPPLSQTAGADADDSAAASGGEQAAGADGIFYNYADGKVELDADGIPLERYEYELPLTNADTVFTSWTTVWFPQFLGDPDYNNNEFIVEQERLTGVNVEYKIVSNADMAANFAALLASDDLCDFSVDVDAFYPGPAVAAIEDEYFANIYDYRSYCPNYIYLANRYAPDDVKLHDTIYLDNTHILGFWSIMNKAVPAATYQVRTDWLERVGLTIDDIRTIDDFNDMLMRFKTQIDGALYPLVAFGSVLDTTHFFACYDFYTMVGEFPGAAIKDGRAEFQFSNDDARAYVEMYYNFFKNGFVDPNWNTGESWDFKQNVYESKTGVMSIAVDEIASYLPMIDDPKADIKPLHKPVRHKDQVLHLGNDATHCFYGRTSISAKCENIPLAVTWCDWRYSPSGSQFASWGIEGLTWEYDENGERRLTDFVLNNPYGAPISWCMTMWAMNRFADHGFCEVEVQYAFADAKKYMELLDFQVNEFKYDGAYEWPKGATLTAEQSGRFLSLCADLSTYISETIPMFAVGDKPLTEWGSFIEAGEALNREAGEDIYTEAYKAYMARR